eukprot:RCo031033
MNLTAIKQKRSWFKEISDIQAFFGTMVDKLTGFRAYLPEAILVRKTEGAEEEDAAESPSGGAAAVAVPSEPDLTDLGTHRSRVPSHCSSSAAQIVPLDPSAVAS